MVCYYSTVLYQKTFSFCSSNVVDTVISTVALAIITGYYAYQTRELARRPFTPYISASLRQTTYDPRDEQKANIVLNITNVGTGTAF